MRVLLVVITIGVGSCTSPNAPRITPVDSALNQQLLTGDGLDTRFFSRRDVLQYYEVTHLDALAPSVAQAALDRFIRRHYTRADLAHCQQLSVLFYRPTLFVNYRAEAYAAARNADMGFLAEHHDALAAQVRVERVPGPDERWRRRRLLYHEQTVLLATTDTVSAATLFHQ